MYARKRGKKSEAQPSLIDEPEEVTRLGDYQVMESIGKGAFGQVYRGLCIKSAETVAIKRVNLQGVPKEELDSIEMEIKQLQGLDHPYIVKYKDAQRSDRHLNIVLEYVESGSLASLLRRFNNAIPEALVALYIGQVLLGLNYLHNQGVIHRDIKGANILSTKEGLVKLADFGVATKLNDSRKSDSVVGTPYWMAPEIIEMTGQQSSACDIWSVGCTVIELLTGKPPFFDLPQMAALFRIVQDDHPPLPDNISAACKSFLLECFQKDPNRRIDAAGLCKHSWVKEQIREHEDRMKSGSKLKEADEMLLSSKKSTTTNNAADSDDDWDEGLDDDDVSTAQLAKQANEPKHIRSNTDGAGFSGLLTQWAETDDWSDMEESGNKGSLTTTQSKPQQHNTPSTNVNNGGDMFHDIDDQELSRVHDSTVPTNLGMAMADSYAALNTFKEDDDNSEDWDLDIALANKAPALSIGDSSKPNNPEFEEDPFDNIEFSDDVDAVTSILAEFNKLLNLLIPTSPESVIVETCTKLASFIQESGSLLGASVVCRAVIPIVELLETDNNQVLLSLLKLVNCVVPFNDKFQQNMELAGFVPAIIKFSSTSYNNEVRVEASHFIKYFCYASDDTRKMFVTCGGIPALVGFLYEDIKHSRVLILNAIDCIRHIFDITSSPRNDFCRLFCKMGLLEPLVNTLLYLQCSSLGLSNVGSLDETLRNVDIFRQGLMMPVHDKELLEYVGKVASILELFSNGDMTVKDAFTQGKILQILVAIVPTLLQESTLKVLKTLRTLSMKPEVLEVLGNVHAVPILLPYLRGLTDNTSHVLQIMYYLCLVNPVRQAEAVEHGIVPHLLSLIKNKHPLSQFAYSLIFGMAKNDACRDILRKYNVTDLVLGSLKDPYWRTQALEVLKDWCVQDFPRMEFILSTNTNVRKLVDIVTSTSEVAQFDNILSSLRTILVSKHIVEKFGDHGPVLDTLFAKFQTSKSANVRISILRTFTLFVQANKKDKIANHPLFHTIQDAVKNTAYPLIVGNAAQLLDAIANS